MTKTTSLAIVLLSLAPICQSLAPNTHISNNNKVATPSQAQPSFSRRTTLEWFGTAAAAVLLTAAVPATANADETTDIDSFLRTGGVSMPMGVSGQAGKMRPTTGVVLRDGSEVLRDPRNGDVTAEIIVKSKDASGKLPVFASFSSSWPLATGPTYDVECRDGNTGDGTYLAVSKNVEGKSIEELSNKFFQDQLFGPRGRFSFYGSPTDVKVGKSTMKGNYRIMDINFSILAQSTGAEIPRKARVIATIPTGSTQAVMLVGSSSALRWKKGSDQKIAATIDSFQAVPAPQTSMRL